MKESVTLPGGDDSSKAIRRLLEEGQYPQAAVLLKQAHTISEQAKAKTHARTLAAAHRICLICSQCCIEAQRQRQACQDAEKHIQQLRDQIYALLDLISEHEPLRIPAPKPHERPESMAPEHPSLWRRLQHSLGSILRPPPALTGKSPANIAAQDSEAQAEVDSPAANLVVYCLRTFCVYQKESLITEWHSLKGQSIFKYLLTHPETPVAKDILMDLFWSDAEPEAARRNLHQAIYALRQTLRQRESDFQHIQFEHNCYQLNPEMTIWLDVQEFERSVQIGQRLEISGEIEAAMRAYGTAESLYQGDFLQEDLYEDWPRPLREHLCNAYLDITNRLSKHYVHKGEYAAAMALCRKILARDNCYEPAHRRLMQCHLAQGQRHLAIRQYQSCAQALKEELDLPPSEETQNLYRNITTS
jgi:DNA-binding SARP family transcriptional activator